MWLLFNSSKRLNLIREISLPVSTTALIFRPNNSTDTLSFSLTAAFTTLIRASLSFLFVFCVLGHSFERCPKSLHLKHFGPSFCFGHSEATCVVPPQLKHLRFTSPLHFPSKRCLSFLTSALSSCRAGIGAGVGAGVDAEVGAGVGAGVVGAAVVGAGIVGVVELRNMNKKGLCGLGWRCVVLGRLRTEN